MVGHNEKYFKDNVILNFFGGRGGTGLVSHNKLRNGKAEPTGGDGGDGGDIYLRATRENPDFSYIKSKVGKFIFDLSSISKGM